MATMLNITERHQIILDKIEKQGTVNVLQLCQELDVSSVTIRKDLKLLEDKKLLFRTYGGATLKNPYTSERPVNEKEKIQAAEKNRIGKAAAAIIEPGDSIIIASGTTVLALAKEIEPKNNLTVLTSALNVTMELCRHAQIDIVQLGGMVRKNSTSITGPYASSILDDFFCSKLFLGVDGIDLEVGLTTTSIAEAHLNRQMIGASQKLVVLSDSTKFGKRGIGRICGIEEVNQVITDKGIPEHYANHLESLGIEVTVV